MNLKAPYLFSKSTEQIKEEIDNVSSYSQLDRGLVIWSLDNVDKRREVFNFLGSRTVQMFRRWAHAEPGGAGLTDSIVQ